MRRLLFSCAISIVIFSACIPQQSQPRDIGTTISNDGLEYTVFTIEGMPCVWIQFENEAANACRGYSGLTCDWTRWKGNEAR